MLFWLEGDVFNLPAILRDQRMLDAFGCLFDSAIRGEHLVSGKRDYLSAIAASEIFTEKQRAYLSLSVQNLTQDGRYLQEMRKIRVSADFDGVRSVPDGWEVPLAEFATLISLRETALIAENLTDGELYLNFARKFVNERNAGLDVRLLLLNGGGDTTSDVVAHSFAEKHVFVCVVDSDRKFNLDRLGQTARNVESFLRDKIDLWWGKCVVIEARELENLLPKRMLKTVVDGMSSEHKTGYAFIEKLPDIVHRYLCFKDGCQLCSYYCHGQMTGDEGVSGIRCVWCNKPQQCESTTGFGSHVLKHVLRGIRDKKTTIPSMADWVSQLEYVISRVAEFGICRKPFRTL